MRFFVAERGQRAASQDRILVETRNGGLLVAVADGAGGQAGGELAADLVMRCAHALEDAELNAGDIVAALLRADERAIASTEVGLTTACVLFATADRIVGASVGDSEAWVVGASRSEALTCNQVRKPLLGDGAMPIAFVAEKPAGALVVGTDGLFRYVARPSFERILRGAEADPAAALVAAARTRSGTLQDDIAVVVVPFN